MRSPATDLATQIGTNEAAWTKGTNLFDSKVLDPGAGVPVISAFMFASGGPPPASQLGMSESLKYARVQIIVRGEKNGYEASRTSAEDMWEALHHIAIAGYVNVACQQPCPLPAGKDSQGNHEWSINVEMFHEE